MPSFVSFHSSVLSSNSKLTLDAVPRSISIPAVPSVTPAPVSPLFSTMILSVITKSAVLTVVVVPPIVKLPDSTISVALILPLTCNLSVPLSVAVPTRTFPVNSAIVTVPLLLTSKLGTPDMSLTLNSVPVKLSLILNNSPALPLQLSVPSSSTRIVTVLLSAPINSIFGSFVCPILGVIKMSLSLFAMLFIPSCVYYIYVPNLPR